MRKNKKGFTLVELLAVIVILAIIMIIATQSVGKTVTRSRTQAFESNMDLAVKNAKRILQTDGTLDAKSLENSLSYSKNEYDYKCKKVSDGYILEIISNINGKFSKIDFATINEKDGYTYTKNVNNVNGKNKISVKLNNNGSSEALNDSEKNIVKENIPKECTYDIKDKYNVGDTISFYDYSNKNCQKFYVINDKGDKVVALSEFPLDFRKNNGLKQTTETVSNDKYDDRNCSKTYIGGENKNCKEFTEYNTTSATFGITTWTIFYGYWVNENFKCSGYKGAYGSDYTCSNGSVVKEIYKKFKEDQNNIYSDYPAYVYDDNSLIKEYVDKYINNLKDSYYISEIEGRLIKYSELISLGCKSSASGADCTVSNKPWLYSVNYFTGSASSYDAIYSVHSDGKLVTFRKGTIRPVIEIDKSEL